MPISKQKIELISLQKANSKVQKLEQLVFKNKETLKEVRSENWKLKALEKSVTDLWKTIRRKTKML